MLSNGSVRNPIMGSSVRIIVSFLCLFGGAPVSHPHTHHRNRLGYSRHNNPGYSLGRDSPHAVLVGPDALPDVPPSAPGGAPDVAPRSWDTDALRHVARQANRVRPHAPH